jgi:hypothetical protein
LKRKVFVLIFSFFSSCATLRRGQTSLESLLAFEDQMSFLQKMGVSVRSWKEFGNTNKLQLPSVSNPNLLLQRLQTNVMHWSGNYLIISAVIFGYGLYVATHPLQFMNS